MGNENAKGSPDAASADRIDTGSDDVVRSWAERLDVSPDQIRDAVEKVGDRSSDVELHLKGSRSTTNDDRVESAP